MYHRPDAVVLVSLASDMGTVMKETSVILLTGHLQLQTAQLWFMEVLDLFNLPEQEQWEENYCTVGRVTRK